MERTKEDVNSEFRLRLRDEFSRRLRANERYSIRSFANHLGLDSSTLSQIFAGKRNLSPKKIDGIAKKAGIHSPVAPAKEESTGQDFTQISVDMFAIVSDWYHYAILDLALTKGFNPDPKWIARKLGITSMEAIGAVERLKRVGMLREVEGQLVKAEAFFTNYSEGTTSAALKEYQRQVIKKALYAVDNCAQDRKDITSITIAADSRKLKEAKEKVKKFRRELCAFLEDGDRDSVYHLTLQLYPVTDIEN